MDHKRLYSGIVWLLFPTGWFMALFYGRLVDVRQARWCLNPRPHAETHAMCLAGLMVGILACRTRGG
jgi:hypothetical protein